MHEIRYDPQVLRDLENIDKAWQTRILKQLHKKLSSAPVEFGKPLQGALKGFWRLRVGDYRVLYEIDDGKKLVTVWLIEKRKDDLVYIEFLNKLKSGKIR